MNTPGWPGVIARVIARIRLAGAHLRSKHAHALSDERRRWRVDVPSLDGLVVAPPVVSAKDGSEGKRPELTSPFARRVCRAGPYA